MRHRNIPSAFLVILCLLGIAILITASISSCSGGGGGSGGGDTGEQLDTSFLSLDPPGTYKLNADAPVRHSNVHQLSSSEGINYYTSSEYILLTNPSRTYASGDMVTADGASYRITAVYQLTTEHGSAIQILTVEKAGSTDLSLFPDVYFPFDGNANDASGHGINAVVSGATLTNDRFGNPDSAYSFDGDDFMSSSYKLGGKSALSVSLWAKFDNHEQFNYLVANEKGTSWGYILENRDGEILLTMATDGTSAYQVEPAPAYGNWMLITTTYDGSRSKLYLNGALVQDDPASGAIIDAGTLYLGARDGSDRFLNGDIDDLAFWNRALSAQDVTAIYNASSIMDINPHQLTADEGYSLYSSANLVVLTAPAMDYHVGDVLISDESPWFSQKILTADTKLTPSGDTIAVLTSNDAYLTDIFSEGRLSFDVTPDWSQSVLRTGASSLSSSARADLLGLGASDFLQDGTLILDNLSLFSINVGQDLKIDWTTSSLMGQGTDTVSEDELSESVLAGSFSESGRITGTLKSGRLKVVPTIRTDYDFGPAGLNSAACRMDILITFDATVEIAARGTIGLTLEKDLLPGKITVAIPPISGIYFDLELDIPASFSLNSAIDGSLEYHYSSQYAIKLDQSYTKADGYHCAEPTLSRVVSERSITPELQGNAEAKLTLEPTVGVKVYKILGPYFIFEPYIRGLLALQTYNSGKVDWKDNSDDLYLGMTGQAGIGLDVGPYSYAWQTDDLYNIFRGWDLIEPSPNQPPVTNFYITQIEKIVNSYGIEFYYLHVSFAGTHDDRDGICDMQREWNVDNHSYGGMNSFPYCPSYGPYPNTGYEDSNLMVEPGTHTVRLTVTDSGGLTASKSLTVDVSSKVSTTSTTVYSTTTTTTISPEPPPATGGLSNVVVDSRSITISVWDHGTIDGDQIDLIVNGAYLLNNYVLTAPPGYSVSLNLSSGFNSVSIHADNEGSVSPNTATISISNVTSGQSTQIWTVNQSSNASFTITAP